MPRDAVDGCEYSEENIQEYFVFEYMFLMSFRKFPPTPLSKSFRKRIGLLNH